MEKDAFKRPSHKEWRRQVKKERRKRLRQEAARLRDEEAKRLQRILEQSEDYVKWSKEQEKLIEEQKNRDKEEHEKLEKAWIEAEVKAQKEFAIVQQRRAKAREIQLAQEEKIRQEFQEMQENQRKKKEAERRRRDEQKKLFDRMKKEIDAYIDDGARTPKALRSINETQPGKEICPFFTKTGACRYGDICSRNHQRPSLSTVILVPNFYTHFSLERHSHEYDTDIRLEYDHRETRNHFRDFYFDVVPELEKFGKIKTLQYCKNTEPHLRGNLYVEYYTEREAARALRGLKGRWYAGRQLHCEFVNLKSWRGAICGMMRCPKGSSCNFLHTFRNPTEEYGVKSPPLWQKRQEQFDNRDPSTSSRRGNYSNRQSNWEDHDNHRERNKNWRWSESPEYNDRRQGGGRQNQYNNRGMQRNYQHNNRNQYNNRNNYNDNRRNDNRNFYNNRRQNRSFNDNRNRFSDDERNDNRFNRPQRRQFNYNDRFTKRRHSDSDGNDDYGKRRRERRSGERRSRSRSRSHTRSRSRSASRSPSHSRSRSRSRSMSRSRSRSASPSGKSHSRSASRSVSRSRTRSRSPIHDHIVVDEYDSRKGRGKERLDRRSPLSPKKRRPTHMPPEDEFITISSTNSNEVYDKKPHRKANPVSKWDSEKREDSSTESRDSRSRSQSLSPPLYKGREREHNDNVQPVRQTQQIRQTQQAHQAQHSQQNIQHYSKPSGGNFKSSSSKGGDQKEYEWDTTESENENE